MRSLSILLIALAAIGCESGSVSQVEAASSSETHLVEAGSDPEADPDLSSSETRSIEYHNPNTGYSSSYDLDVETDSDGKVERINFPNGGYEDDIVDQTDNGDGTVTVTDEDGREFTVDGIGSEPDEAGTDD